MMEDGGEYYVKINNTTTKEKILIGTCFHMALRHQVDDKIQFRSDGELDRISRQPQKGKKYGGGIRFGQMGRNILLALNKMDILNELWNSDLTNIYIDSGIINNSKGIKRSCHQYLIICLSYLRALEYDIRLEDNKYSIIPLDRKILKKTNTLQFGDSNPFDVRIWRRTVVLPLCLRSNKLEKYYNSKNIEEIEKETKNLLKSKEGAYHKYVEGYRVNNCIRSVITPDPTLPIYEIKIPYDAEMNLRYGILKDNQL
ncbi:unnamed protein product [Ambrosiozyma monospora]|uniref:Unnamed protein product n=1 Tax=Ambrosiozyma monospora TaxID=43982 RepID=A0ACB5TWA5_AMBMO|nr:unnamed protein product [Ambrosiozyma monospora]